MKKLFVLILSLVLLVPVIAQNDSVPPVDQPLNDQELPVISEEAPLAPEAPEMEFKTPDKTQVTIGKNEIFIIEDNGDTTKFLLGKKGMSIVEDEDGYKIDIVEMEDEDEELAEEIEKAGNKKFKPHYAGIELGINNFLNADYTLHSGSFMNLNTAKSWNFNLNFLEYGIGLGTSYVGLVTGMGVEWSNYIFDSRNSIEEVNGNIVEWDLSTEFEGVTKSKLATTYLTAPLLVEFQIPAGKKRIHISTGLVGGVKIGSKVKVKYDEGKNKFVDKDDFSLSPLRYGATFRIGYRALNIFANYYLTPLFGETSTPEIYPFSIGLNLTSF